MLAVVASLGLPLGLEAAIMTPDIISFPLFLSFLLLLGCLQQVMLHEVQAMCWVCYSNDVKRRAGPGNGN